MASSRSFQPPPPPRDPAPARTAVTRRQLLVGGGVGVGLLVGWSLWPRSYRPNLVAAPGETILGAFLKIGEDGHVTVVVPQAEMGQGIWTSLAQILADELGADWRTVGVEPAPLGPLYANTLLMEESAVENSPGLFSGAVRWTAREIATRQSFVITAGSSSIRAFEPRLREAGAAARALLCMAAADRFGADWRALDTAEGFVVHGDEKARFGEFAAAAAGFTPPSPLPLREPGEGGISGRAVSRIDLPAKIDGSAQFAADVRLPDMLYAAIRHAPHAGSTLVQVDEKAANQGPGVVKLLRNPGWVAAVATNSWAAEQALVRAAPRFDGKGAVDDRSIARVLETALKGEDGRTIVDRGDVARALGVTQGRHDATYSVPLAPHATIEPLVATARLIGDRLEVWAPTQAPGLARAAAARATGLAETQVTIYPMLVGGGFGRKLETDAIEQAAVIAALVKRPVQLTWSRGEESLRDRMRPPARAAMSAVVGRGGIVQAWKARIAAPSTGDAFARRLMPAFSIGTRNGPEAAAVEGAVPPYAFPALAVEHVPAEIGLETGVWRSAAHSYICFFTESFMDELAAAAAQDPVSYRMQHLGGQPRLARCLQRVAAAGSWDGGGNGQGVAIHSAFGSHVAMLVEATNKGGTIAVSRVVAAVDCGRIIHPDIVRQQVESAIIFGLSAAIGPRLSIADGAPVARSLAELQLPLLADTPEIEVHVMESRAAPGGVAELAVPPVAPAIANAIFASTAERLRDLPLGPAR